MQNRLLQVDAGETFVGPPQILCAGEKHLLRRASFGARGYNVQSFDPRRFDIAEVQTSITAIVRRRLQEAELPAPDDFSLGAYHRLEGLTHAVHRKVATWSVDLDEIAIDQRYLCAIASEALQIPVKILITYGEGGRENCGMRLVRPNTGDANPFHRDGWMSIYTHSANMWIPIVNCPAGSSLRVFAGSHLWPEDQVERTHAGAVIGANRYHVPAAVALARPCAPTEPLPRLGQCLLFSTYLLHGGAINAQPDATRVSVEIRFIEESK